MDRKQASSGTSLLWLLVMIAVGGVVSILVVQQRTLANLRRENERLRSVSAEGERLQPQRQELDWLRLENQQIERLRRDNQEIARLRAEAQRLREQANAVAQLQAENLLLRDERERLQQAQTQAVAQQQEEQPLATVAGLQAAKADLLRRAGISRQIGMAFLQYAQNNQDNLPNDLNQISGAVGGTDADKVDFSGYEILASGKLGEIQELAKTAVVREKQKDARGIRFYVFADGHAELKKEDE